MGYKGEEVVTVKLQTLSDLKDIKVTFDSFTQIKELALNWMAK